MAELLSSGSAAPCALAISVWGLRWLRYGLGVFIHGTPANQLAAKIIERLDSHDVVVDECLERTTVSTTHTSTVDGFEKVTVSETKTVKIRRGMRSQFALTLAKEAYYKFGKRKLSEANILITRKWMRDYCDEHCKDLRTTHRADAIDRALFLSFVPTAHIGYGESFTCTNRFQDRLENRDSLFGRVCRVVGTLPAK